MVKRVLKCGVGVFTPGGDNEEAAIKRACIADGGGVDAPCVG